MNISGTAHWISTEFNCFFLTSNSTCGVCRLLQATSNKNKILLHIPGFEKMSTLMLVITRKSYKGFLYRENRRRASVAGYAETLHATSGHVQIEKASRRAWACSSGLEE